MIEGRNKIFVLDDDTGFLEETKHLLEEAGYQVCVCPKVTESLSPLLRYKPDCLLLDLRMPLYDGHAFVPWLRRQNPILPVIVCTGVEQINRRHLSKYGVHHIIQKPFSYELLFKTIDQAILEEPVDPSIAA